MPCAIGIDVGTTNLKVVLVADDARVIGMSQRALSVERGPGTAEQDAVVMWDQLVDAVRELTAAHPASAADVMGIAVCSQYSSIVPINDRAEPIGPMLMWQDQRGTDHSFEIMSRDDSAFMTFVERHGIPPIGSGLSLGHILYLQLDRPELHERTDAYVEAMDYVTARLTGRTVASQHTSFMVQCCDNRTLGATAYDDDLVRLAGVDPSRLPPLIRVDDAVGTLTSEVATMLALPANAVVYAPTNDTAAVGIATGAFVDGRAGLAIGTTSVLVDAVADFRTDLEHQILSMPGPSVDRFVVCAENGLGGKVLEHVLERIVYARRRARQSRGGRSVRGARRRARRDRARRRRRDVPAVAQRVARAPGERHRTGRLREHVARDRPRRPGAARWRRAWRTTSRGCFPTWRRSPASPFARSCSSGARRGRRRGARCSPTCSAGACLRCPGPTAARRGRWGCSRSNGTACSPPPTSTAPHPGPAPPSSPIPPRHERYAYRQTQFEAVYSALLPISEALSP